MVKDSRDEILRRIRTGLYGSAEPVQRRDMPSPKAIRIEKPEIEQAKLVDQFVEELTKVSGNVKAVESEDAIKELITTFVEERNSNSFAIWESDLLQKLNIREGLQGKGLKLAQPSKKEEMADADIGITEADFAIADTGTIVLIANEKHPRMVSLVPPIHIAVVKSSLILPSINNLFDQLVNLFSDRTSIEEITSCMTFITGPSRTADIELNLTLGVHGPKELFILICP